MVQIEHGHEPQHGYLRSHYVHLHERLVTVGERVVRGQPLGTMGITGAAAGHPTHLHFVVYAGPTAEFSRRWRPINPHLLWLDGVGVVTCFDQDREYPGGSLRLTYPVRCRVSQMGSL